MKRLALLLFVIIALTSMAQPRYIDSDNELIGVGADISGMFSIGVPPDAEHAYVRLLLNSNYRLSSPAGAYAGFLIDSIMYSTNAMINMIYPDSAVNLSDHQISPSTVDIINKWIMTEWEIEDAARDISGVYIQQVLQPQESGGSGTVVCRWLVRNNDDRPHTIGMVLAMDTKIGDSDSAKIWAPGIPYSDTVRVLPDYVHDWPLPPFWEAYEYDPPHDTMGLVARGILATPPNTLPDRIAMADWRDILGRYWDTDFDELSRYNDSGAMLWWFPVTVQPGSLKTITTTYGLSDSSESIGGIYGLSISYPRDLIVAGCQLRPNPFNLIVGVTNNSDSTVIDMQGVVDFSGSSYLTLAPGDSAVKLVSPSNLSPGEVGFVSWSVLVNPLPSMNVIDYFQVTARTDDPDTFTSSPPMPINIRGADYMGPVADLVLPLNNTITSDSLQPIKIHLYDEDIGVNPNRIFFYFYPTPFDTIGVDITDPRLSYGLDTLMYRPSTALGNGRFINFQLTRAEDLYGCPTVPMGLSRFLVDLEGPVITGHFPPTGSIQTDSLVKNYVLAYDVYGSLRIQSVEYDFLLDDYPLGTSVTGGVAGSGVSIGLNSVPGESDTVYWKPAEWTSGAGRIADGYVNVSLDNLTDDPDYGIPNPCLDTPYGWTYIMNSHGPRARSVVPYNGDYVSIADRDVVYYLYDGNSIDMSTAQISIDGVTMPIAGGRRDSIRTIDVTTPFADCHVVNVEIVNCNDSLGTPLDMTSMTSWSYTVDVSAPFICGGSLGHGDTVGTDAFDIELCLDDVCAGIERDSVMAWVDGVMVTLLSWTSPDEVSFGVVATGDSVVIRLRICDMIDVGPANWLDTTFVIHISMEGPRAHFQYSGTGYICSATGPIVWYLYDSDGIDESSIQVTADGSVYDITSPQLGYNAASHLLSYTPAVPWADGDVVTASLDEASDLFGYDLDAPVSGIWTVDLDGIVWSETILESHVSTGGSSYDMLDSFLTIHFYWGDGEIDSVVVIVNGDSIFPGPGLTVYDTAVVFSAADAGIVLDSGLTYEVQISAVSICAFSAGSWATRTLNLYSTSIEEQRGKLPTVVELLPNRPDPFNAATTIPFALPSEDMVRLDISDMLGRHVTTLVSSRMSAGLHEAVWNGKDDSGREMPSGVYNCRIIVSESVKTQRITLIR